MLIYMSVLTDPLNELYLDRFPLYYYYIIMIILLLLL